MLWFHAVSKQASAGCIGALAGTSDTLAMTKHLPHPASPVRISAKIRQAMDLVARQGFSIVKACEEAGCSPAGYHKAMKREGVAKHFRELQERFILELDHSRAFAKRLAVDVGIDLMENSKSETVRARMVEFFLSDGKTSSVQVNLQNNVGGGGGYVYPPMGSRIVEVETPHEDAGDEEGED